MQNGRKLRQNGGIETLIGEEKENETHLALSQTQRMGCIVNKRGTTQPVSAQSGQTGRGVQRGRATLTLVNWRAGWTGVVPSM